MNNQFHWYAGAPKAKQRKLEAVELESASSPHKKSKIDEYQHRLRLGQRHFKFISCRVPRYIENIENGKQRIILRQWPRDPNGKRRVNLSSLSGKEAGNGLTLWGATLHDFYHVQNIPYGLSKTTSTGSIIAKWMRQAGELTAKDELAFADKEEDPKEIPVVDIGQLITPFERRMLFGSYDMFSRRREVRGKAMKNSSLWKRSSCGAPEGGDGGDSTGDAWGGVATEKVEGEVAKDHADTSVTATQSDAPMQLEDPDKTIDKPAMSDSSSNPAYDPSPWSFIPGTNGNPTQTLQQRIPLHLLPKKLYVHDPWNRLSIDKVDDDHETPWLTKAANGRDIIRTYSLSLSEEGQQAALKAHKQAKVAEDEAANLMNMLHIFPAEKGGSTEEPLIEVVLPPKPCKRMQVEEAHLYLATPELGEGNHSVVYDVDWELPRDLFVEAHLCRGCIEEDARRQVQELKDQGKWEELLEACLNEKGEEGLKSRPDISSRAGLSQVSGPKPIVTRLSIDNQPFGTGHRSADPLIPSDREPANVNGLEAWVASNENPPMYTTSHRMETGIAEADVVMDAVDEQKESEEEEHTVQSPNLMRATTYGGLAIRIHTAVKWEDPWSTPCTHTAGPLAVCVPRTATVRLVAKLSIEHDDHLEREAKNYQRFPSHFFEHWNGYNIVPPLCDPVPVGAVCPQFYGYYTPDDPTDNTSCPHYLSPILLLEQCGSEIDSKKLSLDDKHECASLLFRFHRAGWLNGSFAARNILWQRGKPTEWPAQRAYSQKSFRLIDFGRSKEIDSHHARLEEQEKALHWLQLLHHQPEEEKGSDLPWKPPIACHWYSASTMYNALNRT
ncbi:hypothetical protein M405DRAFT_247812 [Rhizopogon salebrosus TDB-379]|nr:hypothetical protein M405DRAFT_247812 [Rhizopogon salebrosus TDB-379]